jgi:antitoxin ParD1/3/4
MATTSMSLGEHWQSFIQAQVDSGRYASATEVVRESLRRMEEQEQKLAALRAMVAEGLAQVERGEVVEDFDFDRFFQDRVAAARAREQGAA